MLLMSLNARYLDRRAAWLRRKLIHQSDSFLSSSPFSTDAGCVFSPVFCFHVISWSYSWCVRCHSYRVICTRSTMSQRWSPKPCPTVPFLLFLFCNYSTAVPKLESPSNLSLNKRPLIYSDSLFEQTLFLPHHSIFCWCLSAHFAEQSKAVL